MEQPIPQQVPCNGCVACCQNDRIVIKPQYGDNPKKFITEIYENRLVVAHKSNGDCIYLDREKGCKIWNKRPAVCQEFDCRMVVHHVPEHQLVKLISRQVIERGKELLTTMDIRRPGHSAR